MGKYFYSVLNSRFGEVGVAFSDAGKIVRIYLHHIDESITERALADFPGALQIPIKKKVSEEIDRCLRGSGCNLPLEMLEMDMLKPFQKKILLLDAQVPKGKVTSYAALAVKSGHPGAARAAGSVMAHNPFPLRIPCHRVVRSDGRLGGFGGGLEMKRALLEAEGVEFDELGRVKPEFFI